MSHAFISYQYIFLLSKGDYSACTLAFARLPFIESTSACIQLYYLSSFITDHSFFLLSCKYKNIVDTSLQRKIKYYDKIMPPETQDISLIIDALTCPITLELFVDPVLASDGHTYERSAIIEWVKCHNGTSPMTREIIKIKELKTNLIVKQLAEQYRSSSTTTTTINLEKEVPMFFRNGTLLNDQQKININRLFLKDKKWLLIYKATSDGFKAEDFHRLCDKQGATLTVIQTRHRFHKKKHGAIFGGYTSIPWTSRGASFRDPQSFLFLLSEDRINRYNLRSSDDKAVTHSSTSGPIFGIDDIHICDRANEHHFSYSIFPSSFEDTNGLGRRTFSKWKYFLVQDIEVYMVLT